MSSNDASVTVGPGFLTLLTVLFVGLKLGNVIAWSWWWVFAPFWIPVAIVLGGGLIALIGFGIGMAFKKLSNPQP